MSGKRWVTLIGENGCGKSTILQALGLLLAGPEAALQLAPRPSGWLRTENTLGKISIRIHQGEHDPGYYGGEKRRDQSFRYSYHITGNEKIKIRNKQYTAPAIVDNKERRLGWLRQNAFTSKGTGWFAVGYGAFRRLTRSSQILVPSLDPPARYSNFITQFDEDQPLAAFERWLVYLDYRIAKQKDKKAEQLKELGILAINQILPDKVKFHSVTAEGSILFQVKSGRVATIALSDGYRSALALAGDLVWRLIQAFPDSAKPLEEEGVVLIDELDIHLHPVWQRQIPAWLQRQFPKLQFIVATHSPLIAAGAGEGALSYRLAFNGSDSPGVKKIDNVANMDVNRILQSEAFQLVSPYSPEAAEKLKRYDDLSRKTKRTKKEKEDLDQLRLFINVARPIGGPPEPGSLEERMDSFLERELK